MRLAEVAPFTERRSPEDPVRGHMGSPACGTLRPRAWDILGEGSAFRGQLDVRPELKIEAGSADINGESKQPQRN